MTKDTHSGTQAEMFSKALPAAMTVIAVAFVGGAAMSPPHAVAGLPACVVTNDRNNRDFEALQAAVDAARAGDTLALKGTCVGDTIVRKSLTIIGFNNRRFSGSPTLVGSGFTSVLAVEAAYPATEPPSVAVHISNLTVTGGATSGDGGGIAVGASAVTVENSTIRGNSGGLGGGIVLRGGTLTLNSSSVTDNAAFRGGGIFVYTGSLILSNSTVTANIAELRGGGIELLDPADGDGYPLGYVTLINSTVTANRPDDCSGPVTC